MKKSWFSLFAVVIIALSVVSARFYYSPYGNGYGMKVTTSDALGYYMYLPGIFIYKDVTQLKWHEEIENKYHVTGAPTPYQFLKEENGNYVFNYLGGVAILQLPFFLVAHQIALNSHYLADGFSPPYQWALVMALAFYCILGIAILRLVLLRYFSDQITGITLLLVVFATNVIQYTSADSAQCHIYLLPLISIVLYASMRWHEEPKMKWAALAGWAIGLATMARPTEAILIFIPIFWGTQTKEMAAQKWAIVKKYRKHAYLAAIMGFIGVLPQLIYWKYSYGSWIYDPGSKWTFLLPWFRVLIGFEKGWFIYTPITIFFIVGMFYIKNFPFRKAVLWFGLCNIYIIISHFDWRYGGSYSTRALSQATVVYALPFAAFLTQAFQTKWKWVLSVVLVYLTALNLFQVYQYNIGVLHFDHMNARYYASIYWDEDPSALKASLMDTDEYIYFPDNYSRTELYKLDTSIEIYAENAANQYIAEVSLSELKIDKEYWIQVNCNIKTNEGFGNSYIYVSWENGSELKERKIRLFRPRTGSENRNDYSFYFQIPEDNRNGMFKVALAPDNKIQGKLHKLKLELLTK
ncbi:MAG: glycosyltransferase family 39 protein [Salibacteraceae bacterium]